MSRLILCLSLVFFKSCSFDDTKKSFVFDNENIFTAEQKIQFDSLFRGHEKRTSNEIVIVTTPNYSPDTNIVFYSVNFLRNHGVGKKDLNNGAVIVFSAANREVRISTGYGTEKVLDDVTAKKIIDSVMVPSFKKSNYFDGLWYGSKSIVHYLELPENKITNLEKSR
jgi:uncharacterized protein